MPSGGRSTLVLEHESFTSYRLLEELVPGRTLLCGDASDNIVVLKWLDQDCFHREQLHPLIRDRLARVRESAHPHLATLRCVDRWDGSPYLVWTYLDGESWDQFLAVSTANLPALFSRLALAVDALHQTGIVHGSIHGRNVIVRSDGQVWLTHVSPYLYADPQADVAAVAQLIKDALRASPGGAAMHLLVMVQDLEAGNISLRDFSHQLLGNEEQPDATAIQTTQDQARHRFDSIFFAAVVMCAGLLLWLIIFVHAIASKPAASQPFPSLRRGGNP